MDRVCSVSKQKKVVTERPYPKVHFISLALMPLPLPLAGREPQALVR